MNIEVSSTAWEQAEADWLIVGAYESAEWDAALDTLNQTLDGQLSRLHEAGDLTGKQGELLPIRDARGLAAKRLLLVGLGKRDELDSARFEMALMTAARSISDKRNVGIAVALPDLEQTRVSVEQAAQTAAVIAQVGCMGQDLFRTEPGRFPFRSVELLTGPAHDEAAAREAGRRGQVLGEAINLTRELINRPAQEIFPASFAERAQELAREYGLDCEIFDEQRLRDERLGALLAVAQGSAQPPRMVVLQHRGGAHDAPTLTICGKGVTFDSGGLSLKPSDGMLSMKSDMAGAATVLGAMTAIARLNLPVNVTGMMGLVENMPSGTAYKLGDVLTARNGVTIEVMNTDAEGRLVLADVLSYAVDTGAEKLIDLATLTGACVVALGEDVTGAFTNDQSWCDAVLEAARQEGEPAWQLPMFDAYYAELIKSDVADIKNTGGRWGGAITAAKLLERFVGGKPWVHLDIAGPSFASSNKPHREGGATGCMVRTLVRTAANWQG